jgi:serine/threonine protein kinase
LIDVYCKVEDGSGCTGVFPWFESIEDEPITWVYEDGSRKDLKVNILKFYLIFQYCPWTLQSLLDQSEGKKFTIDRAHYFFVQMMNGLYYLHAQSVIHRDIKPGNMLITQGKVLNISDFGVAEQFDIYSNQKMKTSVFAGTHQFLSPEITSGAEEYDGEKGKKLNSLTISRYMGGWSDIVNYVSKLNF